MQTNIVRGLKVAGGVILAGLAIFFVFHHGILWLGILAIPAAYLIWDGARGPKGTRGK